MMQCLSLLFASKESTLTRAGLRGRVQSYLLLYYYDIMITTRVSLNALLQLLNDNNNHTFILVLCIPKNQF
jgi:hypothetical protein